MSHRMGMADGRAYTISTASQLLNNYVAEKHRIPLEDNYAYRQLLQKKGPAIYDEIQKNVQGDDPANQFHVPLVKVKRQY
jgi:antitoxin component of RelBE/YafQ-DinJ toxin-antitoxin module